MLRYMSLVGTPAQTQEAAALTFGRLFLMPSIRVSSLLAHVGAGMCAGNSKVCFTAFLPFRGVRAASGLAPAHRASSLLHCANARFLSASTADCWHLTVNAALAVAASNFTTALRPQLSFWHLQVKELMCHLLGSAASAHAQPWSIIFSAFANTPVALRCQLAQVSHPGMATPICCANPHKRNEQKGHLLAWAIRFYHNHCL